MARDLEETFMPPNPLFCWGFIICWLLYCCMLPFWLFVGLKPLLLTIWLFAALPEMWLFMWLATELWFWGGPRDTWLFWLFEGWWDMTWLFIILLTWRIWFKASRLELFDGFPIWLLFIWAAILPKSHQMKRELINDEETYCYYQWRLEVILWYQLHVV